MISDSAVYLYGYEAVISALMHRHSHALHHLFMQKPGHSFTKENTELRRRCDVVDFFLKNEGKLQNMHYSRETESKLSEICGYTEHDGFVLKCEATRAYQTLDEKWLRLRQEQGAPWLSFLYPIGLRNPVNLGTIAKTCECLRASLLLPNRHCAGATPSAYFHSGGALDRIEVLRSADTVQQTLRTLQKYNFQLVMTVPPKDIERTAYTTPLKGNTAVIVGNERFGLSEQVVSMGTHHLSFLQPKHDSSTGTWCIRSLNVNTASALALATVQRLRQNPRASGLFRLSAI